MVLDTLLALALLGLFGWLTDKAERANNGMALVLLAFILLGLAVWLVWIGIQWGLLING